MTEQTDFITTARDNAIEWARTLLVTPAGQVLILDTETTGLSDTEQVVQLSIIDLAGNCLLNTLVKPTHPIPPSATAIHGITNDMVNDAPTWPEVFPRFQNLIQGKTLVIYNAEYDLRLLRQTSHAHNQTDIIPIHKIHCAMLIYSEFFGEWNDYRQSFRWQRLEGGDHTAWGDCKATLNIIHCMAATDSSYDASLEKKLDRLAGLRAASDALRLQKKARIDAILTDEIKDRLATIYAEFAEPLRAAQEAAANIEEEIKASVVTAGATVRGSSLMAVLNKGRVRWDAKRLKGMMSLIPQLRDARKESDPSVTIRALESLPETAPGAPGIGNPAFSLPFGRVGAYGGPSPKRRTP